MEECNFLKQIVWALFGVLVGFRGPRILAPKDPPDDG
jgi:hypothetical protein